MNNRRVKDLFRREQRIARELQRKKEQHETLVTEATSTGAFCYDQEKVTGSSPDGSRQERLVIRYLELEEEILKLALEQEALIEWIRKLIGLLPERQQKIMTARHLDHVEVADIMKTFGISYETYKIYHKNAVKRMQAVLDSIPQI